MTICDQSRLTVLPLSVELAGPPGERTAIAGGRSGLNRSGYSVGQGHWADTSSIADAVRLTVPVVADEAGR